MAIQNTLYGKDLSESEASQNYQVKSPTLTKLAALTLPSTGNYHLALNQEGTDFVFISPATTTDAVSEGSTNLYFTSSRAVSSITGAASTIATSNLTVSRALLSDASGKIVTSTVTSTEIGHVAGVTSALQTQLNTKVNSSLLGKANGVATLDSSTKVPTTQIPALTTQVGFGGEVITVPYTGSGLTIPVPINQGGTGVTSAASALGSLGAQASSTILTNLSSLSGGGILTKDTSGNCFNRAVQVVAPLTISNASGVSANPSIALLMGSGSTLDADLLDGLQGSSYATSGSNANITSLSAITGLGNTSNTHIQITSSGLVGVGTSNPLNKLTVASQTSNLLLVGTDATSTPSIDFVTNPNTPSTWRSGQIYAYDEPSVSYGAGLVFTTNPGSSTSKGTERVRITSSGNVLVGKTTTTSNGGDLQLSKGITFPTTQVASIDANTLDDYREGTWNPQIGSDGSAASSTTTNVYYSSYTKVGNLVTFSAFVQVNTTVGGAGGLIIRGLPFNSSNVSNCYWAISIAYIAGLKVAATQVTCSVQPGSSHILFRCFPSASSTSQLNMDFNTYIQSGFSVIISGSYQT